MDPGPWQTAVHWSQKESDTTQQPNNKFKGAFSYYNGTVLMIKIEKKE